MSKYFASTAFSICVHSAVLSGLYLLPEVVQNKFELTGKRHAITIELTSTATPTPFNNQIQLESLVESVDASEMHTELQLLEATCKDTELPPQKLEPTQLIEPLVINDIAPTPQISPRHNPLEHFLNNALDNPEQTDAPKPRLEVLIAAPGTSITVPLESAGTLDSAAQLTNNAPPQYPDLAIHRRLEGTVLLRIRIDIDGKVRSVSVIESSGHPLLDNAAIEAVSQWHGVPAKRAGRPIESTETLPIRFRL